jgi:hypothetical protein
MIGEFLRRVSAALETAEIPYMLTGSLASSMYGVPRSTNDIDLIVAPSPAQLRKFVEICRRFKYHVGEDAASAVARGDQFNVVDFPNGWKADLIIRKEREFSVVEFERRETHEVGGLRLTIATPEDVLLAKLEWAKIGESERQLSDAAGILRMQSGKLDLVYIQHWVTLLGVQQQWLTLLEMAG